MRISFTVLALFGFLALIGCAGGGSTPSPPAAQAVSVTVNQPSGFTGLVAVTQTLQFTANVTGTQNQSVTWAVNSIAGGNPSIGMISSSGLYTAPGRVPIPQKVTVTATSQADPTRSASVFLTISRVPPTGSWQRTGPAGGTISVLAEDTSHPGTVYAGTDLGNMGALWKSADFGGTWTPIVTNTSLDASPAFDIAVPPSGGGTVIYICHGSFGLSQDGGTTWTDISTPASTHGMAVDPLNRQVIYLSAPGSGVLKSTDGGATWNLLANSPVIAIASATGILHNPITVDLTHENSVYYGTDHGMFLSRDAGVTWTQSSSGFAAGDSSVRDVAVDPANPAQVFALAGDPDSTVANLYLSSDRGVTWTLLSSNLDAERVVPDTVNANTIYLSGLQFHAVYKSTDAGHTFALSDTGMPTGGSSDGSLLLSAPTGTLLPLHTQPDSFLSTIGGVGIFRSQDAAQSWTLSSSGASSWQGFALAVDFLHPATVYLAANEHIFKSVDNGITWILLRNDGSFAIAIPSPRTISSRNFPGRVFSRARMAARAGRR